MSGSFTHELTSTINMHIIKLQEEAETKVLVFIHIYNLMVFYLSSNLILF